MGLVFGDLIRRFNEAANGTAGDHFTPPEVIRLMVNLLLEPDTRVLAQAGLVVTICDPARGTGGMLDEAQNWIRAHSDQATARVYGQDYNPRSYALAASDLLIKVKAELDASGIYLQAELDAFSEVFFAPKRRQSPGDQMTMDSLLDQAVERFRRL